MIVMTADQQVAFDWIAIEHRDGWNKEPVPFNLIRFRSIRDSLVRAGLVMKTTNGRHIPVPDKPLRGVCNGSMAGPDPADAGSNPAPALLAAE